MGLFDSFPLSNAYAVNLDWIMKKIREVEEFVRNYAAVNNVAYAGVWDITKQYPQWALVTNGDTSWMSLKPVPVGIPLENVEYWQKLADLDPRIAGIITQLADVEKNINGLKTKVENLVENLKITNVLDYGADPTGNSDSTEAFLSAKNSGLPVYVPYGDYKISGNVEIGDCLILGKFHGGNVNITGEFLAPEYAIFQDTNVTVDTAKNPTGIPEWFGGSIQRCVNTFPKTVLKPKVYRLDSDLIIEKSNTSIIGDCEGLTTYDYGYDIPVIECGDFEVVCGGDSDIIGELPRSICIKNVYFEKTNGNPVTIKGVVYGEFENITVVCRRDCLYGMMIYHAVSTRLERVRVQLVDGESTFFGFYIPNRNNIGAGVNASLYFRDCSVGNTSNGVLRIGNVRGWEFDGNPSDTYMDCCETARCDYGIVIGLSGITGTVQDFIVRAAVIDDCFKKAVEIMDNANHSGVLFFSDCYLCKGNYDNSEAVFSMLNSKLGVKLDCQIINNSPGGLSLQIAGADCSAIVNAFIIGSSSGIQIDTRNAIKNIIVNGVLQK